MKLLSFFVFMVAHLSVFSQIYYATKVSSDKGLSHSVILDILQDKKGFIWIATGNGLNRYDGYNFIVYRHSEKDSNTISHDIVNSIAEDQKGYLWIATQGGFDRFDPASERFTHYAEKLTDLGAGTIVQKVFVDYSGDIWLSTYTGNVVNYDPETDTWEKYSLLEILPSVRTFGAISFFKEYPTGIIWIGSSLAGLFRIDIKKKQIKNFLFDPKNYGDINSINGLYILNPDTFITSGYYLYYFYPDKEKFERVSTFKQDNLLSMFPVRENEIWILRNRSKLIYSFNTITKQLTIINLKFDEDDVSWHPNFNRLVKDRGEVIWLGTIKQGIYKIDMNRKQFHPVEIFRNGRKEKYSAAGIFEDSNSRLWMVTLDGKIFCKKISDNYFFSEKDLLNISGLKCWWYGNFAEDNKKMIWFSSWFWEIYRINIINGKPYGFNINYTVFSPQNKKLVGWSPRKLVFDINGHLWVGYFDAGLEEIDPATNFNRRYYNGNNSVLRLSSDLIWTVFVSSKNEVYIGTDDAGFDVIDAQRKGIKNYRKSPLSGKGLMSNSIRCFTEDKNGLIWIGTSGGGLSCFNPKNGNIDTWMVEDGLSNNVIYGILIDGRNSLWCATENGLSRFFPPDSHLSKGAFRNYYKNDGTGGDEYNINSCIKTRKGEMFFGGTQGFICFYPDSIFENPIIPNPIITGLRLFNNPVSVGQKINGQIVLPHALPYLKEITLNYRNRDFTIEFSCDHYAVPEKNMFSYRLKGYDLVWKTVSADRRYATYTNLKHGRYLFEVKALNCDGIENPIPATLNILITPPWFFSPLAFVIYIILILFAIFLLFTILRYRSEYKKKYLLERFEKEKQIEIAEQKRLYEQMKVQFYAKITHEFRTPLALIITPIEQLLKMPAEPKIRKYYQVIGRNASRLLELINQLLDLAKIHNGKLSISASYCDMVLFLEDIYENFLPFADKHEISFHYIKNIQKLNIITDCKKLETILMNLISNAFKYTPRYGEVKLTLEKMDVVYKISVMNSGPIIPPDELPLIFESYYQASNKPFNTLIGTGLGLTLVKELVALMNGSIKVSSQDNQTIFTMEFPLTEFKETPNLTPGDYFYLKHRKEESFSEIDSNLQNLLDKNTCSSQQKTILLIDDDEDFRFFIKQELHNHFKFAEASNGEEGLAKAFSMLPDMILCDVMMPVLDGYRFCQILKSDPRVNHIPVILISAKRREENQVKGLEAGAIDFLSKPFQIQILYQKIVNVLKMKEQHYNIIKTEEPYKWIEKAPRPAEKEFLTHLISLIEKNMMETKLNPDFLAKEIGLGRTVFYKKVKNITNLTAKDFINSVRLHAAYVLLKEGSLTISEVAFKTGFADPSYFSKCFKKQFGSLPKDISKGN